MLETIGITKNIKSELINNGYYGVSKNMQIELFKESLTHRIFLDLGINKNLDYDFYDLVELLDWRLKSPNVNMNKFCSYIYSSLNIISEIQGTVISWEQRKNLAFDEVKLEYDEAGYITKMVTSNDFKPSKVLTSFISKLGRVETKKILEKW